MDDLTPTTAGLEVSELSGAEALDAINGRLKLDVPHVAGERVIEMRGTVPADWSLS
ncbi:hypothetical protein [Variovorax sp. N23]|uniref:hypothetical protein n=1 Tax=Variovorax sp. N23 TaxID=2980555 RepID=UPI0021C56D8E|nr:hypothetical protein [Variovorax sp. N23]MCU4119344.1 hypothetical protein [Variovorax sp. N23]